MSSRPVPRGWSTKDDVMQDLAVATGAGGDVDDHCLLYGERPPPRPECGIDDEMKILFPSWSSSKPNGAQNFTKPDLKGIMSMIRMVETEEDDDFSNKTAKPNDIIVISKLNPNVKEFVPKSTLSVTTGIEMKIPENTSQSPLTDIYKSQREKMTSSPLSDKNKHQEIREKITSSPLTDNNTRKEPRERITSPLTDKYKSKEIREKMTSSPFADKDKRQEIREKIISSPLTDNNTRKEQRERITSSPLADTRQAIQERLTPSPLADKYRQKETLSSVSSGTISSSLAGNKMCQKSTDAEINSLKDKILSKTGKDPYEHRRQKNAAIATLLRHCTTPPIKDVKEKPIKLYTPDFFEHCKAADFKGTDDSSTEVEENIEEHIKDAIIKETEPKEVITEDNKEIEHTNLTPDVAKDLKLDDSETTSSYELVEQQKSIAKVDEWLNGPKSPKKVILKPVLHAGPISYKRKEVMSPSSTTSVAIDKKMPKHDDDKAFVPSSYAYELRMKYEKKKMEANKSLNIWDNLEAQLKKKDEEIRKKSVQED